MGCSYGSVWRKWDFHVHTPYSILNNDFGFNPFELTETDLEKEFDKYVIALFTTAVEKSIAAIGITDYFMIEGYKRIKEKYLMSPSKMQMCFPNEELRKKVEEIYIFPNIEFRLKTFVGEKAHSVNYHVIFSGDVLVKDIQENFLNRLTFQFDDKDSRTLTLSNIKDFGRQIKAVNEVDGSDLDVGLEKLTVDEKNIWEVLKENTILFSNRYLIAVPVDEDLSQIRWDGRDYSIRRVLYQQSDCLLTANQKTIKWALAHGREQEQIKEFGSIKPCIWGSDAHGYEKMFQPDLDRFCWIKAEPTFNGLMQIIYEPGERVKIQKESPTDKDEHQIIDSIVFHDDNFQSTPIVFNDALTCIIGGKSTGKSLLLRQVALAIDKEYIVKQESVGVNQRKQFEVKNTTVTWKDGTTEGRKIVYIPQTYLNKTIDNPEKTTAINKIISDVLLQEPEIQTANTALKENLNKVSRRVRTDIADLITEIGKLKELKEEIKKEGASATFSETLNKLKTERAVLAERVNVSQDEIDRFAELEKNIQELTVRKSVLSEEIEKYINLAPPCVVIPGYFSSPDGYLVNHNFRDSFPETAEELDSAIESANKSAIAGWNSIIEGIKSKLSLKATETTKQIEDSKAKYNSLKEKVEQSEQLQKLTKRIEFENKNWQDSIEREKRKGKVEDTIKEIRNRIIASQMEYMETYTSFCNVVKNTGTKKNTNLIFDATVVWKQNDFMNCLASIFNNKNFSSFKNEYHFDLNDLKTEDYGERLLNSIWDAMDGDQKGVLNVKGGYTIENTLQRLFDDWYNVHYIVKSGNDTIEEMSPGKKALVLLEMLISLEDSKCPILIDQPEDDLDNRSIYDDLVQYIKSKKKERQIIIVTHNANVVLGADAEEVIIANQHGKDTENTERRFEYRSGAIENDEVPTNAEGRTNSGILYKSGIQTQICNILEGGPIAFQLRQDKYSAISNR